MKNSQSKQIKWDIVDYLLSEFADTANSTFGDYSDEERIYARDVIKRIAANLNVKNHIFL